MDEPVPLGGVGELLGAGSERGGQVAERERDRIGPQHASVGQSHPLGAVGGAGDVDGLGRVGDDPQPGRVRIGDRGGEHVREIASVRGAGGEVGGAEPLPCQMVGEGLAVRDGQGRVAALVGVHGGLAGGGVHQQHLGLVPAPHRPALADLRVHQVHGERSLPPLGGGRRDQAFHDRRAPRPRSDHDDGADGLGGVGHRPSMRRGAAVP